jgi:hypothetical protein
MNAHQRRRRIVFWRGSFPVILGFVILVVALILADRVAPENTLEFDGVNLHQQVGHSQKLERQGSGQTVGAQRREVALLV